MLPLPAPIATLGEPDAGSGLKVNTGWAPVATRDPPLGTSDPRIRGTPDLGHSYLDAVIIPHAERPVYRQIADDLRGLITSGHIGPGHLLPSSKRMEQEYGYSRETIKRALAVLVKEGLVVTERGYGTRVREPSERELVSVPRGARWISRPATPEERASLGIAEGGHVSVVTLGGRVRGVYATDATEFQAL